MKAKREAPKKAKGEPTLREQVKTLTKKVNKLLKENKALVAERRDLTNACEAFRELQGRYGAVEAWMKIVFEHLEKQDVSLQELYRALNREREKSLMVLKPFRSPMGKLVDEGAAPIDGNAADLFRSPKA